MIDTTSLHSRIADRALDYLSELYPSDKIAPAGQGRWRIGSHGSLALSVKEDTLVFYSHEEGAGGDAVALWQRVRGGTMGEALKAAAAWAQMSGDGTLPQRSQRRRKPKAKPIPPPEPLTPELLNEARANCERLAGDVRLCERIAQARGWKTETVRGAALDGALGWSQGYTSAKGRELHRGAIVFVYGSGLKHRWQQCGKRKIEWTCGKAATLWRGQFIAAETQRVFVTEGETDALALIDAGAEDDPSTKVVGLPSAGAVPWGIADLLGGRDLVLCLDHDEAGRKATEKLIGVLGSRATTIKTWEVSHE